MKLTRRFAEMTPDKRPQDPHMDGTGLRFDGMEMIRFGAFAGLPKQLLQASAKIWESAGFKVALFDDIKQTVWDDMIGSPMKAA